MIAFLRETTYPFTINRKPPEGSAMHHDSNRYRNDTLLRINPYIRRAWYHTMPPGYVMAERVLFDYELVLLKSGHAAITVSDERYEAGPGDIFLFKPCQRHSFTVHGEPLVQPHIHFDLVYDAQVSATLPVNFKSLQALSSEEAKMIQPDVIPDFFEDFPSHIRLNNSLYIEQLLFHVISAYEAPQLFTELQLKWRFLRLLDQLLCEVSWQHSKHTMLQEERARQIKLYLEHHADRRVDLEELAGTYHIDRSYVVRCFRDAFHMPPIRYHLICRINRAKTMLLCTNLPLASIAEQTGFSSPQDFSRAFRRIMGVGPSVYRKNAAAMP